MYYIYSYIYVLYIFNKCIIRLTFLNSVGPCVNHCSFFATNYSTSD